MVEGLAPPTRAVAHSQAEVGSNELHLLRYIYLITFFG